MFTRLLVGDHLLNYLARQIKDMLRDPLASQKLASLVREVVTVVVQQVIPTARINSAYLAETLHENVIFELRPVPPEPVRSLGLQVLHEHPRVYLRLAHLQEDLS